MNILKIFYKKKYLNFFSKKRVKGLFKFEYMFSNVYYVFLRKINFAIEIFVFAIIQYSNSEYKIFENSKIFFLKKSEKIEVFLLNCTTIDLLLI